ncbi:hypothetical protein ABZ941_26380 [Streptomyces rubiginosohelvolus]|uniref:hypothetical protein n=1 Tax=Streptomyces rubiginosohelvolus TaxID=67362 RepID=UPI0033CE54EF
MDGKPAVYRFPKDPLPLNKLSLDGTWTAGYERFTAGPDARLAFSYRAKNAISSSPAPARSPSSWTAAPPRRSTCPARRPCTASPTTRARPRTARLELRLDKGLEAYAFTFG